MVQENSKMKLQSVLANANRTPSSLSWSHNGIFSYCSGSNVLSFRNQECINILQVISFVHSIDTQITQDNKFIVLAGLDDGSVVIKCENSEMLTINLDQDAITIVTLSENGETAFAANINGGYFQIDTKTGDFKKVDIKNDPVVICMKCCDDFLFIGLDSGSIHIYDNGVHIHKFSYSHSDWVRSISVIEAEPEVFHVLSASQDQTVNLQVYNKKQNESTAKQIFSDHNALVYNVHWIDDEHFITSSMNGTMLVYKNEEGTENATYFQESARTGQMHASNQHVGFWCAVSYQNEIRAITYTGAFYQWELNTENGSLNPVELSKIGGHVGRSSVSDISWSPNSEYLLSCSTDQTTRGFTKNGEQFARPQVHGYDLTRVCHLTDTEFVSSAEEKELRIFKSTVWFKNDLERFVGETDIKGTFLEQNRASQPVLGLTNKDVGSENDNKVNNIQVFTEDSLSQDTLWPEHQKLYSHGNEVISCAVDYNDLVIASASKAKNANDAQICIWKRENKHFKVTQKIKCHNLTVTDFKFSESGEFLISVGRDRTLGIHKKNGEGFQTIVKLDKAQSRIIWSVDCVEFDGKLIIFTGSRDKSLCVWIFDSVQNKLDKISCRKNDEAVTAVACKKCDESKNVKVAVGYESGNMELLEWNGDFKMLENLNPHNGFVKRLRWNSEYLASCSDDGQVRIYKEEVH